MYFQFFFNHSRVSTIRPLQKIPLLHKAGGGVKPLYLINKGHDLSRARPPLYSLTSHDFLHGFANQKRMNIIRMWPQPKTTTPQWFSINLW